MSITQEMREFCETLNNFLDLELDKKKRKYGKYRLIKKNDPIVGEKCIICLDTFKCGYYKRELECGHTFHKKCIDKWFRFEKSPSCPVCREIFKKYI